MKKSAPIAVLGEVCSVKDGTHYSPENTGGPYPFLTVKDMTDSGLSFSSCSWISEAAFKKTKKDGACPETGAVLFSKDGTVGKVHVVRHEREFAVLSSIAILRPKTDVIDSAYLGFALRSPEVLGDAQSKKTGSALRRIILEDLFNVKIPVPAFSEQRRIAAQLEQADLLQRTRRYTLELSDSFLPATFRKLFGDRFCDGTFQRFGDLVTITGGGTPARENPDFYTGKIPWFTSKDMRGEYIWDTEEHITEEGIQKSATKLVPAGSILLVVKSKVLMHRLPVAISKVALCHGQDIKSIQCSSALNNEVGRFALWFHEPRLLRLARGANTEGLTLPMIEELPIPKFSEKEQRHFATLVAQHERLRATQRESLRQAEHLFQTLLHQTFHR